MSSKQAVTRRAAADEQQMSQPQQQPQQIEAREQYASGEAKVSENSCLPISPNLLSVPKQIQRKLIYTHMRKTGRPQP